MKHQLSSLFSEVLKDNQKVLDEIEPYGHPLSILLRKSLEEQESMLQKLVREFKDGEPDLKNVKTECTAMYHANQIANPHFEDWARAVGWMDYNGEPSKKTLDSIGVSIKSMEDSLTEAAKQLDHDYGEANIRYVIPTFYLPEVRGKDN